MYTLTQLTKYSKQDTADFPKYRLALLGDNATQHTATALKGYAYTKKLALEIFDADYDQILPQVMDSGSEMYRFKPDAVLIHMCTEKLYDAWCQTPETQRTSFAQDTHLRIQEQWNAITANSPAQTKIMQFTFIEYDDAVFGNYAARLQASFIFQLRKLNLLLMENCPKNVSLIDLCGIASRVGSENLCDVKLYYIAKLAISPAALPTVAARVIDTIQALRGSIKKCAILDLDNTLWGGVIGDDGLAGIQIGELGSGPAYSALQTWLKELKRRGIILAVCSKNEEAAAKEPFEKHNEMILRLDDIAMFIANWEDKASNIRRIQETLNIGMDSIVFIDDNPFEREAVSSLIPEITVPDMPDNPELYLPYLQSLNLFETVSYSEEDAERTKLYQIEAQREALRMQFSDYGEYLQSLDMIATAAPFDEFHTPRIAQLTQRSNQFNLRTIRYTEAEIEAAANDPNKLTLYFTLKDRLADHGLISVVILEKETADTLFIETWLMSCRVLKRGMEEFIINKIIETARQNGFAKVRAEYIKTEKNAMVADIYEKLGFTRVGKNGGAGSTLFTAGTDSFKYNETYIRESYN